MRVLNPFARALAIGVPIAVLVGCNQIMNSSAPPPGGDPSSWEQSTNLNSDFGGYTFTDEPAAFGDPEVRKVEVEEAGMPVADADSIPSDSTFVLRILWGQLQGNPGATTEVDWSGRIGLSQGGLAVLRTIAFERPSDHLLPRQNRQVVGFVSDTGPSFDGLLLRVRDVPGSTTTTLRFATAAYTHEWSLTDLRDANWILPVDSAGNAVSITAVRRDARGCPNGFVRGEWVQREGDRGVLFGVWLAADALPVGHLRGHFGIDAAGAHVWFAKIVGPRGQLIGLARGQWEPSPDSAQPGGLFHGEWRLRLGERGGVVEGHYLPARSTTTGAAGFFEARWQQECTAGSGQPG